jgi:hypothetical protein
MIRRNRIVLSIASLGLAAGLGYAIRARASGVPSTGALSYAGVLDDANGPISGSHNIQVVLYDAAAGGNNLCQTTSSAINVANGQFSLLLPDTCTAAVAGNPNVWVDVFVDGADTGTTKIGAVPYAVEANHTSNADNATNATNATTAATANAAGGTLASTLSAIQGQVAALQAPPTVQQEASGTNEVSTLSSDLVYQSVSVTLSAGTWAVSGYGSAYTLQNDDAVQLGLYNATLQADVPGSRGPVMETLCVQSGDNWCLVPLTTFTVVTVTSSTLIRLHAYRNGTSQVGLGANSGLALPTTNGLIATQLL